MSSRLQAIAEIFCVDKLHSHSYIGFYSSLFEGRTVNRLLEIGIGYAGLMAPFVPQYIHGASLRMWAEYFPEANIYGCDIRGDTMFMADRVYTTICDQSQPLELLKLAASGPFEVVIDDGSHQFDHQLISAATLLPYVTLGGVYVIEDCCIDAAELLAKRFDGQVIYGKKRPDDNLVVIRR